MNERLKQLRKHLNLTQTEFGKHIGMSRDAIAGYERGVNVSEPTIRLICKEFDVNYNWLVNGNGSMFVELTREEEITKYIAELVKDDDEMKEFQRKFIRILSRLSIDDWKMIEKFVEELAKKD